MLSKSTRRTLSAIISLGMFISALAAVPASAATGSISFSTTRFSDTVGNSATVSVSLSDLRGVQSMLVTCGSFFTAFSIPDYNNVLLTANGLGRYLPTSGARPQTKLIYNNQGQAFYATTSVSFSFSLGFGKGSIATSGSCSPSIQVRNVDGQYSTIRSNVTLSFVKGGSTAVTPSPTPTPTATPSNPDASAGSEADALSNVNFGPGFPCQFDLADSGEQEIEDWRIVDPQLLPAVWRAEGDMVCTDLKQYASARFDAWSGSRVPGEQLEFIDWMARFHPQKSVAVCTVIMKSTTSSSTKTQLRANAKSLCESVPSRWRYDIVTRVEDWVVDGASSIEPQVELTFQSDVTRPVQATNTPSSSNSGAALGTQGPGDGEFSAWTKLLAGGKQLKFYVKYPQVDQKIQFMVQGQSGAYEEVAWIRITEEDLDDVGNYRRLTNEIYFIRTLSLRPGKNRVRILVDGKLVWGTRTYSLK